MENTEGQFCFTHLSGEDIYLFRLNNTKGTEVCITNYGAIITSFRIKQSNGKLNNIVLGFDDVQDYFSNDYLSRYPYFGAAIGRYANRIKNGEFLLGDKKYALAKNRPPDHLHGGVNGFDKKIWKCVESSIRTLMLTYRSEHGEEGYPGNLETTIRFELTEDNELIYAFTAHTDHSTPVNMTHHSYFNLNNGEGKIDDHLITINARHVLTQDANFVANGGHFDVINTRYDFTNRKRISADWLPDEGYDQSFVLDIPAINGVAAEAYSPISGLRLQVFTTEPVIHFYTGKWIPDLSLRDGKRYGPFSGFCFETQKHPNAINFPGGPDTVLHPGEQYHTKTIYRVTDQADEPVK